MRTSHLGCGGSATAWRRPLSTALAVLLVTAAAPGCAFVSSDDAGVKPARNLMVAAASSLNRPFLIIGERFERRHAGTQVSFNFAASSTLAAQIEAGAPTDVFASADEVAPARLAASGKITQPPRTFARNRLAMIVKPGNPTGVATLADLPRAGTVALCATEAPCGRFAEEALRRQRVTLPTERVTRTADAQATFTAVVAGDADAAVVYASDTKTRTTDTEPPPFTPVAIPAEANVEIRYPVVPLRSAADPALAQVFADELRLPEAQQALAEAGFELP